MSAVQQAGGWWEYRLQANDLPTLAAALAAIQAAGLLGAGIGPDNMLGDHVVVDASNPVNPNWPLFKYGVGTPAEATTNPDGTTTATPAIGTVGVFYIAIRTTYAPAQLPMDPTTLGLAWSDQAESVAVLGRWS